MKIVELLEEDNPVFKYSKSKSKKLLVSEGFGLHSSPWNSILQIVPYFLSQTQEKGKATRKCNKETFVNTFHFSTSFVLPLIQSDLTFLALSFLRMHYCTGHSSLFKSVYYIHV